MNVREKLIGLSIVYQGKLEDIIRALNRKEDIADEIIQNYLNHMKCEVMTILDENYPAYLRESPFPPLVLFYYGDISLIFDCEKNIGVVGGRKASYEGIKNVEHVVSGIAKKYNIVSGLALGIDTIAHKAALYNGGRTIAVLPNGIEYCYPSENYELYKIIKKKHLIISEYYNYISPDADNFRQRNRLIAAFSKGTIIGEAHERSGTSITANYTIQQNKDLMCLPSNDIFDSLNNKLIQEGAALVMSSDDVIYNLNNERKSLLCKVK